MGHYSKSQKKVKVCSRTFLFLKTYTIVYHSNSLIMPLFLLSWQTHNNYNNTITTTLTQLTGSAYTNYKTNVRYYILFTNKLYSNCRFFSSEDKIWEKIVTKAMSDWVKKHYSCELRRRRAGVENSLGLPGLRISFVSKYPESKQRDL